MARRRVAVFIDYQNCYGCARAAFHTNTDPGWCGHFSPRRLANLLASKGTSPYELTFVGVYAGLPDSTKDPRTYGARRKQMAGWEKEIVTVRARPLRYPHDWPNAKAEEKGVDVQLAIDAVMAGFSQQADTAIIASCDSDLMPAVEALVALKAKQGFPDVELIAWKGRANRIGLPGQTLTYRWVGDFDYKAIQDLTDYNL